MPSKKGKYQPIGVGMAPCTTEIGRYVRTRRLELNLRQVPLAERAGFKQIDISRIEIGITKYLTDSELQRLAEVLQCDPEELRKRMPVKKNTQPQTELGKLIRSRRDELDITIKEFSEKIGMSVPRAKRLEIKKFGGISYRTAALLANALQCDPSTFSSFVRTREKQTTSELGRFIRTRRKELGISIAKLALQLKITPQNVSSIEYGRNKLSGNSDMVLRLAHILTIDVNVLLAMRPQKKNKRVELPPTDPLGSILFARRSELHLSIEEVSKRINISSSYLYRIERGVVRPGRAIRKKLAEVLHCDISMDLIRTLKKLSRVNRHPRC